MATRLSKSDWAEAGLRALARGGAGEVSVEGLAKQLGSTKGSFYWHFRDRAALIEAALELWEERGTTQVIAELEAIADPVERLAALFGASFGQQADGLVEADLVSRTGDPAVAAVLARVTRARIAFLAAIFADLGLEPAEVEARALMTYAAYVGFFQIARGAPELLDPDVGPRTERLLALLVPAEPGQSG